MSNLSSNAFINPWVGVGLSVAAAISPAHAAVITTRDTRAVNPTGTQFDGSRRTAAAVNSPLNGSFSVMQERWTPEASGGRATFSFDTAIFYNGASVTSPFSFTVGNLANEPLNMVFNIWKKDQFNPADLTSGLVATQIAGRTGPNPIRSGTAGINLPVFSMNYEFTLPSISEPTEYLIGFARQSNDIGFNRFEIQRARNRSDLLIYSSPDHVLSSFGTTPSGSYFVESNNLATGPIISSKLVITTVPEPTTAILGLAAFSGLARRRR